MKRIQLLDYARLAAALAVIICHYTHNGIRNGKVDSISRVNELADLTKFGHLGVYFFFMISGYVILFSAQNRGAASFAASRALRLYPTYWAAVIFTSVFAVFWGGDKMEVTPLQFLANLTMVQYYLGFDDVDGVYWTLLCELKFYFFIFTILAFGKEKYLPAILTTWPFIIILSNILGFDGLSLFTSSYFLYFAAGSLFALITQKVTFPRLVALALCYYFCMRTQSSVWSEPIYAFVVTVFFAFFGSCLSSRVRSLNLPLSKTCGAVTYPIYLIHAHFGYILINHLANDSNKWFVWPLIIGLVFLISLLLHYLVEVRLAQFWKKFFKAGVEIPVSDVIRKLKTFKSKTSYT